jgi:hypothetical protein
VSYRPLLSLHRRHSYHCQFIIIIIVIVVNIIIVFIIVIFIIVIVVIIVIVSFLKIIFVFLFLFRCSSFVSVTSFDTILLSFVSFHTFF